MGYWDSKKKSPNSSQKEYDISNIDQSVFDDPVLLLEYLEKHELQEKASSHPTNSKDLTGNRTASYGENGSYYYYGTGTKALYGYRITREGVQINQTEAEAVSYIIHLHDTGYSYSQIEYLLGHTKHRTITGKKFYLSAIQAIIKNRKVYEGKTGYPPILHSKKNFAEDRKQVIDDYSDKKTLQTISQNNNRNDHSSAYWNAIEKMQNSIAQRNKSSDLNEKSSEKNDYRSIDEFLLYVMSKGIPTRDNRWNDGCVWVQSDPKIDIVIASVQIKGRGFKYTAKCKAFDGKPGWYY